MSTIVETNNNDIPPNEIESETTKPWSAKATLGLTLLLFILYIVISFITLVVGAGIEASSSGVTAENAQAIGSTLGQELILDGDFTSINYLVTALCLSPLIHGSDNEKL